MKKGFTLIELLVVIGILGILMAVLVGTFSGSTESARASKCQSNMRNLAMAVQSVGMETSRCPYAGSFDQYDSHNTKTRKVVQARGWISWSSEGAGGKYISPYDSSLIARELSLTNGTLWSSLRGSRDCYVCPTHLRYAKDHHLAAPLWSYAMNAYFLWASKGAPRSAQPHGRWYRSLRRSDRRLLFAELPFADAESGAHEQFQKGHTSEVSGNEGDPVLQYSGCEGGGNEAIGFNHKDGKNTMGHVCFADGHVEKLRVPKTFSESDAKELTKWLCHPVDDQGQDFDIRFDGQRYEKAQ